ncbi:MAG TPA: response regulator, partial [Rhodothermales bacterium]|nr:response regulator [Rhodothermales bacterium]
MFPSSQPAPRPPRTGAADRPRILVADDVPENRQLFSLYLRTAFEVVTASTAEEAIATLRSQPFDAALLDINYGGGMDGF